jgi:chromosome segregation ATPase
MTRSYAFPRLKRNARGGAWRVRKLKEATQNASRKYRYDYRWAPITRHIHPLKAIEAEIAEKRQQQSLLVLNRREMDDEIQDLTRSKTEVECLVTDLRSAEDSNESATEQLQNQLQDISQWISEKEVELMEIEPEWASAKHQETDERRKYVKMPGVCAWY